jgi:ATP-dependent helicase/nuclease subunit A
MTTEAPPTLDITILSAGAGSGKTYTLTGKMVDLLKRGVRAGGIVATTFTQKAAAELQERVRVRLLEAGLNREANELGSAMIGTVHSIGIRLLQRFAFEAGVSPLVEIIADGDQQRLFNESLSQVLTDTRIEAMNRLADRLGLTKKTLGEPYDWRRQIRELTDVARANNFSRAVLEASRRRSWESFEQLLPPVSPADELTWQNRLMFHLTNTMEALEGQTADETKVTRDAIESLRNLQNQLQWRGELYWYEWVQIAKVKVGAKSKELVEELRTFALSHDQHRQFRADVKGFIDLLFDIAMDALGEFETYKKKRGLIDYTDMETYVSQLLRIDSVCDTLREELDLLLVDEFQDTSPIQLDIFLRLSRLAKHSIWVGDPKQSIYGFRGAEPALMQAIVGATGGVRDENILKESWRSRPDLVHAANAIFTRAFDRLPAEQVVLEPARLLFPPRQTGDGAAPVIALEHEAIALGDGPAREQSVPAGGLVHWHFLCEADERKTPGQPWLENCLAAEIRALLDEQRPVWSKNRRTTRAMRPGDVAVLCRSNLDCQRMAEALHRAGLKAAIARAGLLDTPECRLVLACLKYLLSSNDALSTAEILLLTGAQTLEEVVDHRLEWLHRQQAGEGMSTWAATNRYIRQINALRPHTADLSASEILTRLLDELDLRRTCAALGFAAQRLDNVDRLRKYALDYESACNRLHTAASLGGFLLWLDELARQEQDWQGSGESPDAVKVLTYHKSKGLEYPVTICHQLDHGLKEKVWGLNLVSDAAEPDLDDILGHRWLRFWVNPYADNLRGTQLEEALQRSPAFVEARRQALEEEARLLYVGLTRARDYLVFPTTPKGTRWLSRVFNHGDESVPVLDPHSEETPFYWHGDVLRAETRTCLYPKEFEPAETSTETIAFHPDYAGKLTQRPPAYAVDVHFEAYSGFKPRIGEPVTFATPLTYDGKAGEGVYKALHALCIAAPASLDEQLELARRQIEIRQLKNAVSPEALCRQVAAFRTFCRERLGIAHYVGKFPLEGWYQQRLVRVEVDVFLEGPDTIVAVQFAQAEGMKKWKKKAESCAVVLGWVQWLAEREFNGKKFEAWVVFGSEGMAVEVA